MREGRNAPLDVAGVEERCVELVAETGRQSGGRRRMRESWLGGVA